jgi:type II secretory pathway component PulC
MKFRLLSMFVLVALVALAATRLLITHQPPDKAPASTPSLPPTPPAVAAPESVKKVEKPRKIPPDIMLHGTFINEQTKMALISADARQQRWFNLKEYLNNDFYLDGIFKEHVLVRDTGNTIALEVRITDGGATQGLPDIVPAMPAHAWVESLPPIPGIDRMESNRYRIKRDLVMKELKSGEIFKQVLVVPQEEGGFSIDRIKEGSMVEVIGLRVGDTIHKINDRPLTNITDVLELYKNLESLEKIDVEISRMHEVQNLHYELE